jgi:hypothetical protein
MRHGTRFFLGGKEENNTGQRKEKRHEGNDKGKRKESRVTFITFLREKATCESCRIYSDG